SDPRRSKHQKIRRTTITSQQAGYREPQGFGRAESNRVRKSSCKSCDLALQGRTGIGNRPFDSWGITRIVEKVLREFLSRRTITTVWDGSRFCGRALLPLPSPSPVPALSHGR